ncbi:MAG TPA: GNAT family N-acetyltransferase [Polyangiaceae bacterium]|jgi:phosphinothricin acetyltransferase|nr:GNAT family N-acetyltransferase [Polyangiaceae bacterium]
MQIVECNCEEHAGAILEILNDAILNSTAVYDYEPRTKESIVEWFSAKRNGSFPVLGAIDDDGALLGFASYGTFRSRAAYKYSVEHSVYVARERRGIGVGSALMQRLIAAAMAQELHVLVGGIDAANRASIVFHEKLGFVHAGTIAHAGFKFGRWLDLAFYQLLLTTPAHPVDG